MKKEIADGIGSYVRKLRGKRTRKDFMATPEATKEGSTHWITEAALCRIEKGYALPTLDTLAMIAKRARVPVREVFIAIADILDSASELESEVNGDLLDCYAHLLESQDNLSQTIETAHGTLETISYPSETHWATETRLVQIRDGKDYPTIDELFRLAVANGIEPGDALTVYFEIGRFYATQVAMANNDDFTPPDYWE